MMQLLRFLSPFPPRSSPTELARYEREDKQALERIEELRAFPPTEIEAYLEAAQRVADYEDRRKSGAENRATAYIAAIATLIPLMTWALGNSTPFCSGAAACRAWSGVFDVAVIYFVIAAYWSLKTLRVANYHTIGVEDVVKIKERGKAIGRELIVQTLLTSRANRNTINLKLDFIQTAQRCFFLGLLVLAGLLALDPWFRLATPLQPQAAATGGPPSGKPAQTPAPVPAGPKESSSKSTEVSPPASAQRLASSAPTQPLDSKRRASAQVAKAASAPSK